MMRHLLSCVILLIVSVSVWNGCSSTVTPPITVSAKLGAPAAIEYGLVKVGQIRDTNVSYTNTGTDTLRITSETFSAPQFSLPDPTQSKIIIAPGGYNTVRIRFLPTDSNSVTAYDTIHSNAGTAVMQLHGGGIAITRLIDVASSIDLGSVRMGLCADPEIGGPIDTGFVIRNSGNDTLAISGVTGSPAFVVLSYPSVIKPGDTGTIHMRFCPNQLGANSGTVTISSNGTVATSTVINVTGTGLRYSPGAGSIYGYISDSLDANLQPVTTGFTQLTIQATGVTYQGLSGVTQTKDANGKPGYFRIESNGDVSDYGVGVPVDSVHTFGDGWVMLPFGSHATNVNLFPKADTSFMTDKGKLDLHLTGTASYEKDTTIAVQGKSFNVSRVREIINAVYSAGGTSVQTIQEALIVEFSPDLGFLAAQLRIVAASGLQQNSVSRDALVLEGYNLH